MRVTTATTGEGRVKDTTTAGGLLGGGREGGISDRSKKLLLLVVSLVSVVTRPPVPADLSACFGCKTSLVCVILVREYRLLLRDKGSKGRPVLK